MYVTNVNIWSIMHIIPGMFIYGCLLKIDWLFSLPETTLKWFITVLLCISVHFTYSFAIFPAPSLILSVLTWSNESVNHYHPPSDPKTDLVQGSLLWSIHQSGSCLRGCLWDQYALFRTSCLSTYLFLPVSVYEAKKWGLYMILTNLLWLYWPKGFSGCS